jgi:hypothetical protein
MRPNGWPRSLMKNVGYLDLVSLLLPVQELETVQITSSSSEKLTMSGRVVMW